MGILNAMLGRYAFTTRADAGLRPLRGPPQRDACDSAGHGYGGAGRESPAAEHRWLERSIEPEVIGQGLIGGL